MAVATGQQLAATLGGRIERDRLVDPVFDTERLLPVGAVHRGGRGIGDRRQSLDAASRLQHDQGPHHIGIDISVGVFKRVANPGLCREMDDAAQLPVTLDEGEDAVTVGDIELGKDKARIGAELGQPRLLQPYIIVIIEIVEAHYPIAALEQRLGNVEADKPGGTGEKDRHDYPGAR